ncbi:MAG TPA: 50S ribosomal protein L19, partial [bacterium]|nr:50S ribosomal protein L19 [bacterium]
MNPLLQKLDEKNTRSHGDLKIGDTLRIEFKVKEGDAERIQAFEGVLISRRGRGPGETITLRKVSFGVGVEKIFPLSSPLISGIKALKHAKVRRAKL